MVGNKDPWVTIKEQEEYASILSEHGVATELIIAKNKKHDFLNPKKIQDSQLEMNIILQFIITLAY